MERRLLFWRLPQKYILVLSVNAAYGHAPLTSHMPLPFYCFDLTDIWGLVYRSGLSICYECEYSEFLIHIVLMIIMMIASLIFLILFFAVDEDSIFVRVYVCGEGSPEFIFFRRLDMEIELIHN